MVIGIDCDGVIRDFDGKLEELHIREHKDHHLKTNLSSYHLKDRYKGCPDIRKFAFDDFAKELFTKASLYPKAKQFMDTLKKDGHTIVIVSTQPNDVCKLSTLTWLSNNGISYDKAIFSDNKGQEDIEIMLDDYVKNLNDVKNAGKRAICFDQTWNQEWAGERVKTYDEFIKIVNDKWQLQE